MSFCPEHSSLAPLLQGDAAANGLLPRESAGLALRPPRLPAILPEKETAMKKLVIASDIHGSAHWCRKMLERFAAESEGFAPGEVRLLLLGDVLYHGPRNDLPEAYAPKEVIAMLNPLRESLFCVRGNCDGEVDQMVLDFPIMADYAVFELFGHRVYATHGHRWNAATPPPLCDGDALLYGHFHIPLCEGKELTNGGTFTALNPGSTSLPKGGSAHSLMVWDESGLRWIDLASGETFMEWDG